MTVLAGQFLIFLPQERKRCSYKKILIFSPLTILWFVTTMAVPLWLKKKITDVRDEQFSFSWRFDWIRFTITFLDIFHLYRFLIFSFKWKYESHNGLWIRGYFFRSYHNASQGKNTDHRISLHMTIKKIDHFIQPVMENLWICLILS